jgi:hypothetical protein
MGEPPKTLRVFWERRELRDPSGKARSAMILEIQSPCTDCRKP